MRKMIFIDSHTKVNPKLLTNCQIVGASTTISHSQSRLLRFFIVFCFALTCLNKPQSYGKEIVPACELVFNVKPYIKNSPLNFNKVYSIADKFRFKLSMLAFYISDLTFVFKSKKYLTDEISLLRLEENISQIKSVLPAINYTSVQFAIGVKPAMNDTANPGFDIMNYARSHPLSFYSNMFWSEKGGYTFLKIEGKIDPDAMSTEPLFQKPLLYHVGTDPYYRNVTLSLPLSKMKETNHRQFNLIIDLDRFFAELDPLNNHDTQTMDNPELARRVMDRFAFSLRIEETSTHEN